MIICLDCGARCACGSAAATVPGRPAVMLVLLFVRQALALSLADDSIPLLTSFVANVTTRSAAPNGPVFSTGLQAFDTVSGSEMHNTTNFLHQDYGHTFYLRLCPQNISYFM